MSTRERLRILVVDDNPAIHADFRKILGAKEDPKSGLADARAAFFGKAAAKPAEPTYEIDAAAQGREALERVRAACEEKSPYALAFVDVRMPPGWDGVETIARLWEADPDVQCVICTAFADYSWEEMIAKLGRTDRLLILKKPFDPIEVCQIASAMTEKWSSTRRERARLAEVVLAEQKARVYASTVETTNRALELSRARAEAALEAKTNLFASLGQELRTPLLSILEYADLLRALGVSEGQRMGHAGEIQRQGEALLRVISDVSDLAQLEAGKLEVQRGTVAPLELVARVVRGLSSSAQEKGLDLSIVCTTAIPDRIETDGERVQQALRHLVENAIKFTDHGSVRIEVALDATRLEDPRLVLTVVDTGPGLSIEQQGRLFEPFTAVDARSMREQGGAGLGLVLARGIARRLGGDLSLESAPGKGCAFGISIQTGDLSAAQLVEYPRAPIPSAVASNEPLRPVLALDGVRVLLVEDVQSTQKLFIAFLETAGAEVVLAENGREAIEFVQQAEASVRPFDVILMDVQMPVMDGHAATRELRARGYVRPIVAVTAHAMTGDREACLAAGCNDYASKPLGRKALVELCALYVTRRGRARERTEGPEGGDLGGG